MNPVILSLLAPSAAGKTDLSSGAASKESTAGGDSFGILLNRKISAFLAAPKLAAPAKVAEGALRAVEAKIVKLRNAGASEADIVSALALQLAASVAKALGTPAADARAQLQAMFAGALAPPGDEGNAAGSLADRLRNLAQRFLKLQTIATSIAAGKQLGQQNLIAGNFLDATTAKETPAPAPAVKEATTFAAPKETPTAAVIKETMMSAALKETPASVTVKETPASVTVKETPASVTVKETPASAVLKEAPTTTSAVKVIPSIAALKETPPTSAAVKETPTAAAIREMPLSATEIGTPTAAALKETPASAVSKETPTFTAVKDAPASAAVKDTLTSVGLKETRAFAALKETPTSADLKVTPASGAVKGTPASGAVKGTPASGAVKGTPASGAVKGTPPSASVKETATTGAFKVTPTSAGIKETATSEVVKEMPASGAVKETTTSAAVAETTQTSASARVVSPTVNGLSAPPKTDTAAPAPAAVAAAAFEAVTPTGGTTDATGLVAIAQRVADERDGRTVKLGAAPALSTDGDTLLGRVLTRAVSAAVLRETPDAAQLTPSAAAPAPTTGVSSTASQAEAISGTGDANLSADAQTATNVAAPDTVLAAFVKSFEAALGAAAGAPQAPVHDDVPSAASPAPALAVPATGSASAAFVPAVAPFSIEQSAPPAAPAPPVYATPVDQSAIVDQVLRGVFMRNTGESSEIRLSLVPQALGDVNVQLVVSAGNVSAHVVAQTPEVRDALVAAQPQLAKSLADAGLKLQGFTVDLSGSGFAGFSQRHADQSPNGNNAGRATGLSDNDFTDDDVADATLDAVPSFGPSILATASAGAYNYLA